MNFGVAAQRARAEGIPTDTVRIAEDQSLVPSRAGRRGLAAAALAYKVAGAAVRHDNMPLTSAAEQVNRLMRNCGTAGAALREACLFGKRPPGRIPEGCMEMGLGIHNEPGAESCQAKPAAQVVRELVKTILNGLEIKPGEEVVLLVNGMGSTSLIELHTLAKDAISLLRNERGLTIRRCLVGSLVTSIDAHAASLTIAKVDDSIVRALDAPASPSVWPFEAAQQPTSEPPVAKALAKSREKSHAATSGPEGGYTREHLLRFRRVVKRMEEELERAENRLAELDESTGDGDCGSTMKRLGKAALSAFDESTWPSASAAFIAMSDRVSERVGGTSGSTYVAGLCAAGDFLARSGEVSPGTYAGALNAAVNAVRDIGGANEGDRTMVDALLPAARAAMEASERNPGGAGEVAEAAAEAAHEGAARTKAMTPKLGRASYLTHQPSDKEDPGALAVSIWLNALAEELRRSSS